MTKVTVVTNVKRKSHNTKRLKGLVTKFRHSHLRFLLLKKKNTTEAPDRHNFLDLNHFGEGKSLFFPTLFWIDWFWVIYIYGKCERNYWIWRCTERSLETICFFIFLEFFLLNWFVILYCLMLLDCGNLRVLVELMTCGIFIKLVRNFKLKIYVFSVCWVVKVVKRPIYEI